MPGITTPPAAGPAPTDLVVGTNCVVFFEANPKGSSPIKSNKVNGHRTKKIVLPILTGIRRTPQAGESWVCRVERITNEGSKVHGAIIVRPLTQEVNTHFPDVYVDPLKAKLMAIVLQEQNKNLMLVGDQGIGKTTISHAIAKGLGWKFRKVSGGSIKKVAYMLGRLLPTVVNGQQQFTWVNSPLVNFLEEAARTPEHIFLLMVDEYSRIDEDARDILLDLIEGQTRVLHLPNGTPVPVPANVRFMAAANEGGAFVVRKADAAAKDRWVIVKIEHMPQQEELAHCLRKYPSCPKGQLDKALTIINHLRVVRHNVNMRLSKTISTRAAENCAMFLGNGIDLETALTTAVVNQFEGNNTDVNSEAGRVVKIISEKLKQ